MNVIKAIGKLVLLNMKFLLHRYCCCNHISKFDYVDASEISSANILFAFLLLFVLFAELCTTSFGEGYYFRDVLSTL